MRPSLRQVFASSVLASIAIVGSALCVFVERSRQVALSAAEHSRKVEAARVEAQVALALGAARDALADVERMLKSKAVDRHDARALEVLLYTELSRGHHVAEVTFSGATLLPNAARREAAGMRPADAGSGDEGSEGPSFASTGRFQLSVFRLPDGRVATRSTTLAEGGFRAHERVRAKDSMDFESAGSSTDFAVPDPTLHATFRACAALGPDGDALWSDLHYSELDAGAASPRVVLTVQKAVWASSGEFLGVARVGLSTTDIDAISEAGPGIDVETSPSSAATRPPGRIALFAVSSREAPARLVARLTPEDSVVLFGDDLRILPVHPPPEVAALLDSPLLIGLDPDWPAREGSLTVHGETWLATLSPLSIARAGTQGWLVAVLVPEAIYTRDVVALGRQLVLVFGAAAGLLLAIGGAVLWSVRRGLVRLGGTALRMRQFDFRPSPAHSRLRDIQELLDGLERAKTATRALCKYVPVPLVRRLHENNRDPELGGELAELSLLFTDIQGFTALSERLGADQLAQSLGAYLACITETLEARGATIDKYIGDAVMAFWNAPVSVPRHSLAACRGVLESQAALARLYESPRWQGLPPLVTRFGLHRAEVLVGHFGAPSRLSYTALGDGVNLTARLESLCKQYGVTALASDQVVAGAREEIAFRHIDRVIVSGKHEAVGVHELLGFLPLPPERRALVDAYEEALGAYLQRDFAAARARLAPFVASDEPSRVLSERCARYQAAPPPLDWDGVYVATSK